MLTIGGSCSSSRSEGSPMFLRRYERQLGGRRRTYWALVESVRTGRGSRQRGVAYLGELKRSEQRGWGALGGEVGRYTLLEKVAPAGREEVPWPGVAATLTIARFCRPQSELHIESTWYRGTALEDLLGVPVDKIHTDRLYDGPRDGQRREPEIPADPRRAVSGGDAQGPVAAG